MKRLLLLLVSALLAQPALAERIKDIANIDGVRPNQLVGYGVVVGLDNTGDTLTVNLVEKTEARRKSETKDERKADASIDVPSPYILGRGPVFGATTWEPSASSKQEFKDNETNTNEIKGSITVTVVEVLANGHLVVAGEKQVAINHDTEYIRLSGVVNPARIRWDNTVNSTQLANVKIESKNAQSLDVAQLGSMMARFFLTLLPF
jgi:flagellar L-ring protein precursor FlgH